MIGLNPRRCHLAPMNTAVKAAWLRHVSFAKLTWAWEDRGGGQVRMRWTATVLTVLPPSCAACPGLAQNRSGRVSACPAGAPQDECSAALSPGCPAVPTVASPLGPAWEESRGGGEREFSLPPPGRLCAGPAPSPPSPFCSALGPVPRVPLLSPRAVLHGPCVMEAGETKGEEITAVILTADPFSHKMEL